MWSLNGVFYICYNIKKNQYSGMASIWLKGVTITLFNYVIIHSTISDHVSGGGSCGSCSGSCNCHGFYHYCG